MTKYFILNVRRNYLLLFRQDVKILFLEFSLRYAFQGTRHFAGKGKYEIEQVLQPSTYIVQKACQSYKIFPVKNRRNIDNDEIY